MQTAKWMLAGALSLAPLSVAWAQNEGLSASADNLPWPQWQARLSLATVAPLWRGDLAGSAVASLQPRSLSLMGDYYFARSMAADGSASGFRATSGLVVGQRQTLWIGAPAATNGAALNIERRSSADLGGDSSALPYLGVGYSGLSGRGGWSFSADFGLVALASGNAVRLGRVFTGAQTVDDLVRELRLAPVLQLGVSYSF